MNLKSNKNLLIAGVLLFLTGAGSSYYFAPSKTETKTKIVTKTVIEWKEKESTKVNKDLQTIIIETKYPDGTIKTETRIVDKGTVVVDLYKNNTKSEGTTTTTESKTTRGQPQWRVSALASTSALDRNSLNGGIAYGVGIERKILGPISAGLFGISNNVYGASVSISF